MCLSQTSGYSTRYNRHNQRQGKLFLRQKKATVNIIDSGAVDMHIINLMIQSGIEKDITDDE